MTRPHPPGEAEFRSILPEDIEWKPFPAFPPMMRLAVLVGRGDQAWPLRHQGQSAVCYIGLGEQFDGDKVKAYPPGSRT